METLNVGQKGKKSKTRKNRKYGRNAVKCAAYRARKGLPLGPGIAGNKSGKNRRRKAA